MKCTRVQDLLKSDYLDAELNQELRWQVESHLEKCPTCQALKQRIESQRIGLRETKQKDVPPEIWQNIQSAIIQERLKEPKSIFGNAWEGLGRVFSIPRPAFALASAAGVLILALVAGKAILGNRQFVTTGAEEDAWAEYRLNGDTYIYNLGTDIEEYFL